MIYRFVILTSSRSPETEYYCYLQDEQGISAGGLAKTKSKALKAAREEYSFIQQYS